MIMEEGNGGEQTERRAINEGGWLYSARTRILEEFEEDSIDVFGVMREHEIRMANCCGCKESLGADKQEIHESSIAPADRYPFTRRGNSKRSVWLFNVCIWMRQIASIIHQD